MQSSESSERPNFVRSRKWDVAMSRVFDIAIVAPGDREETLPERLGVSRFGLTQVISDGISALGDVFGGISSGTSNTLASGLVNAGVGAGLGALTGGSPLAGALTGGALGLMGMG